MKKITYFDIGAHDPVKYNNTYGLYTQGHRGVCVEPNPDLCRKINQRRPGDVCLNVGVTGEDVESRDKILDFHVMSRSTLSTFSREQAESIQGYGKTRIDKVIQVPILPVSEILDRHFDETPSFVSIDVEGLDDQIMKGFDLETTRPEIFCIETLTYREDATEQKEEHMTRYMESCGYLAYADTYINTLFVDKEVWRGRARLS